MTLSTNVHRRLVRLLSGRAIIESMHRLLALTVAGLVGLALLVTACGGSSTSQVAQLGSTTRRRPGRSRFARCMRSHGVPNYPDPTSSGTREGEPAAARGQQLPVPVGVERVQSPAPERRQRARAPLGCSGSRPCRWSSPSASAATASGTSPTPRATAAYPTLPPLESIRARRSSRPRTEPAGSTGRPTCPRMPPTTPTPGHKGDERDERREARDLTKR